jgi:hypothetical protein
MRWAQVGRWSKGLLLLLCATAAVAAAPDGGWRRAFIASRSGSCVAHGM